MKKQSLLQYVFEFIAWTLTPITFLIRIFIPAVPTQNELEILDVRAKLKEATDYKTWKKLAIQLDQLEGKEEWKKEKESPLYDYELIEFRLNKLRDLRAKGDIHGLVLALRAGLLRNLGGLGNVNLHTYCAYGTKYLVEEYISEVEKQLQFICDDPDIETEMDLQTKFNLFYETRQAFGRTALLLSGGAGLGLYHFGVIKALHDEGILEHIRVVSGSSVGSLIGSLFATKKSDEIPLLWEPGSLMLEAFEKKKEGNLRRKFNRLKTKGVLMDVSVLEDAIRKNIGDITFQEAFEKTGKVLNVPVASTKKFEFPRTLNYLTAPNVLIWSAASASCAFPGLYEPVQLMCKDHTGQIVEYHPSGLKWSDGSVESDLPMSRLSEMFNINHFIVSQVNPHIAPFLRNPKHKRNSGLLGKLKFFIKSEIRHRIYQMAEMGVFSSIVVRLQPLISQKYEGDITIVPEVTLDDYNHIISNPTEEFRQRCTLKMQNSTFEKIHIIKSHCRIEWCLEKCVAKLRKRLNSPEYYTQLHSPSGKKTNFKKESSFMFE